MLSILLLACSASPPIASSPASIAVANPVATEGTGDAPRDPAPEPEPEPDPEPEPENRSFDHLPVLLIDTHGRLEDGDKVDAELEVVEEHDGTLADLDTARRAARWPIGVEIHGSTSSTYPKLPLRFECRDPDGSDGNCPLVGLPAASDWVLHAPYSDKTFLRNALAYSLARDLAKDRDAWEPRSQLVELFLDGEYEGVYLLVERITVEDARLDIPATVDAAGVANGGFVVKIDQHRSEGFDTDRDTPVDWVDPHASEVTSEGERYIEDWFDRMEAALDDEDWTAHYREWIDVDAFVDHWLLNELTHNIDAYRLSAYLWTDGPPGVSRLRAGPAWDFDRAWGNVDYCACWETDGWIHDSLAACGYADQYPFWWERLRESDAYRERLRARWDELRAGSLSDEALATRVDTLRAQAAEAEPRDHARWGTLGVWVDPNFYVGATWDDEVDWLREWALARAAWMDRHVGEP